MRETQSQVFQATLSIIFETPTDLEFVEGALTDFFRGWNRYLDEEADKAGIVILENVKTAKIVEWIPQQNEEDAYAGCDCTHGGKAKSFGGNDSVPQDVF